jgi:hypothetical protein
MKEKEVRVKCDGRDPGEDRLQEPDVMIAERAAKEHALFKKLRALAK